jgi:hypothetical protein
MRTEAISAETSKNGANRSHSGEFVRLWNFLVKQINSHRVNRFNVAGPAFSVSPSQLEAVLQYIETQQEHHGTRTFQEEYRELLRRHGIDFDERYVWDRILNCAFSAASYGRIESWGAAPGSCELCAIGAKKGTGMTRAFSAASFFFILRFLGRRPRFAAANPCCGGLVLDAAPLALNPRMRSPHPATSLRRTPHH